MAMASVKSPPIAQPRAASPMTPLSVAGPNLSPTSLTSSNAFNSRGPAVSRSSSHHTAGYVAPQQQPQSAARSIGRPQSPTAVASPAVDQESITLSNTLANSQTAPSHPLSPDPAASMSAESRPAKFNEEWEASQRGSSIIDGATPGMQRSNSFSGSTAGEGSQLPSRGNTLKKKPSLRRSGSLRRSSSRRSMKAGSVRSLALQSGTDEDEAHSAFYCPVPTSGNPTETLATRFQAWRKILKDLVAYFREIQNHYEQRSKSLLKLANVLNNTATPPGFLVTGGLDEALQILRAYNKQAVLEANKAREIEEDVILALTGLRSDLQQKIKEIKGLSGDFKNTVEKEMENTRRAVNTLQSALGQSDLDPSTTTGKQDPFLLRLAVDRQLDRQLDEENYLHQAYLNLENSGRELESIVVGEIQKSYNAYAGILKREADAAYTAVEELRVGPIAMPKHLEWTSFVQADDQFIDATIPIRSAELIHYPGRDHYACQEIRAGLLERKSKYLKSYTAGWYVLSPTHLHEFKSADKTQAPVMSLYLPEQKLGSHSTQGGSSNKFILKGRQTGGLHRGHTWVFRAESHDTMMAWYDDIKALTEKTPQERSDFVRGHSRSFSRSSQHSFSSDGVLDDEDDEPFAAGATLDQQQQDQDALPPRRPKAGGRFPSDVQLNAPRGLQASPSSVSSGNNEAADHEVMAAASALPGSGFPPQVGGREDVLVPGLAYGNTGSTAIMQPPSHAAAITRDARMDGVNPYTNEPTGQGIVTDEKMVVSQITPGSGSIANHPATLPATGEYFAGTSALPRPAAVDTASVPDSAVPREPSGRDSMQYTPPQMESPSDASRAIRPSMANARTDSVPTISSLHIPGEYPRGSRTG